MPVLAFSPLELRSSFDERGQRLWEDRKLVKGEGHTFINPWPDDLVVREPEKAFQGPPREGCASAVPLTP